MLDTGVGHLCGGRGCLEQLVSGRVLDVAAQRLAGAGGSAWLAARAGERGQVHAGDLDAAARAGDRAAREELAGAAAALVAGLRSITAALDPEVIVLGGGCLTPSRCSPGWSATAGGSNDPRWSATVLRATMLGAEAGLRGAALIAGWPNPATHGVSE